MGARGLNGKGAKPVQNEETNGTLSPLVLTPSIVDFKTWRTIKEGINQELLSIPSVAQLINMAPSRLEATRDIHLKGLESKMRDEQRLLDKIDTQSLTVGQKDEIRKRRLFLDRASKLIDDRSLRATVLLNGKIHDLPPLSKPDEVALFRVFEEERFRFWATLYSCPQVIAPALQFVTLIATGKIKKAEDALPAARYDLTRKDLVKASRRALRLIQPVVPREFGGTKEDSTFGLKDKSEAYVGEVLAGLGIDARIAFEWYKLVPRGKEGDIKLAEERYTKFRDHLIYSNLRLTTFEVKKALAHKGHSAGLTFDDLQQETFKGLTIAVDRFDVESGFKFSTTATWWVKQGTSHSQRYHRHDIRIPPSYVKLLGKARKEQAAVLVGGGSELTAEELVAALGVPRKLVEKVLPFAKSAYHFDTMVGEGEELGTFGSMHEDPQSKRELKNLRGAETREALLVDIGKFLDPRECSVLELRRLHHRNERMPTLEEVGRTLRISKERVRQLEARALRKLREPEAMEVLEKYRGDLVAKD